MPTPSPGIASRLVADPQLQDRIHVLWDELSGFEASKSDAALRHLLTAVAEMIGAENAYWMGAVRMTEDDRDPLAGWRPRILQYLRPLPNDDKFTQQRIRAIQKGEVDEATVAQARLAGTYRA